ncbi:MAG TPA: hypothetical protein VEC18_02740 [Myxococcota bacterium]|nr:hypothetical protein [Myxococcota bacterium]
MDENAVAFEALTGIVYLLVGLRLYALSQRTRLDPEWMIAAAFLLWTVCYAFHELAYLLAPAGEPQQPLTAFIALLALNAGNIAFALFTRVVFRARERWAGWLVAAIALGHVLGAAGSAWVGDWGQIDPLANPAYWPQSAAATATAIWMGVEGFLHYTSARRRRKIGLCDAITCHNFLLWCLVGVLWAVLEGVLVVQDLVYVSVGDWSDALGLANGVLELVPIALIWLVFFPPAAYRRWVEGAARA